MVTQNLNSVDRVLRFALAFWWLGPWAPSYGAEWANWLVLIVGWIALVESFVGYCWLQKTLGIHTK
ncbi:MAG: DUF2892 domain-containing protein [Candidatus Woesearchaeota archaeon]|nr:DUF2892 domain-containing protein [Candidatus Woesearchaeota archaeon]